jgi:hypothetical protein
MRIKIAGDWSGTVSFAAAGIALMLMTIYGSQDTVTNAYIFPVLYLIVALWLGIMAARGRRVPDNSTFAVWENAGFDLVYNGMSVIGLFLFATGTQMLLTEGITGYWLFVAIIVFLVIVWGIAQLNFAARIMVFTPEKKVILLKGRPFSFIRKTLEPKNWLGLHVAWVQGYNGGMRRNDPANLYYVWGVYDGGVIKLNTVSVSQDTKRAVGLAMVREMVEETAARVGLPVPPWPDDEDIYLRLGYNGEK